MDVETWLSIRVMAHDQGRWGIDPTHSEHARKPPASEQTPVDPALFVASSLVYARRPEARLDTSSIKGIVKCTSQQQQRVHMPRARVSACSVLSRRWRRMQGRR